jgi:hypothetical protein
LVEGGVAGLMERTMSKNTAINNAATGERELNEAELDAVSGGFEYTERTHGAPKQEAVFPTETIKLSYGAIEWTYTK